jgi:hypothetical protein
VVYPNRAQWHCATTVEQFLAVDCTYGRLSKEFIYPAVVLSTSRAERPRDNAVTESFKPPARSAELIGRDHCNLDGGDIFRGGTTIGGRMHSARPISHRRLKWRVPNLSFIAEAQCSKTRVTEIRDPRQNLLPASATLPAVGAPVSPC